MDDFYTEQLIKKQADSKDTLKKAGLIVLTVLSVLLVFAIPAVSYTHLDVYKRQSQRKRMQQ